jgi:uncharacterized protein (DUF1778 family)
MPAPQSRSEKLEIVLDSALTAASDVLAWQSRIALGSAEWTAFMEALDAPPRTHHRMERLLNEPALLE